MARFAYLTRSPLVRIFLVGLSLIILSANQCQVSGVGGGVLLQTPGFYTLLSQHCYPQFGNSDLGNDDVQELNTRLSNAGWNLANYFHDESCPEAANEPAVRAAMFGNQPQNVDFIYFSGHGDRGINALYGYNPEAPNCLASSDLDGICFTGFSVGQPTSGNLKWIFAFASQNISLVNDDPNQINPDWTGLFNGSAFGLHGYYGFVGEPNDTSIVGEDSTAVADHFADCALGAGNAPSPTSVHDCWQSANMGTDWGEIELQHAMDDRLSNMSNSAAGQFDITNNPLIFTWHANGQMGSFPLSTIDNTSPGTYAMSALSTESYSDSSLASIADSQEPGSTKYYSDSNQYQIISKSYTGSHYEASQALIVDAPRSEEPYSFTQDEALSFAASFLQANSPLPTDAILTNVGTVYQQRPSGTVILSYDFTWRHNNGIFGGDAIRVGVDNVSSRDCTDWEQIVIPSPIPGRPGKTENVCDAWQTVYNQHINYCYRLWRQPTGQPVVGSFRHVLSIGGPTVTNPNGSPMLSPQIAFENATNFSQINGSSANMGALLGYTSGYWTPPFNSTDNTAYPAYHFYFANHYVISVDAFSGQPLGVASDIE